MYNLLFYLCVDSGAGIVQGDVTSQHQQPAAVPSFMNRAVVTSMSVYQQQPSALLEQQQQSVSLRGGPPPFLHQQPQGVPVQVVPPGSGQYMMDARWNTMAVDQDVRRGMFAVSHLHNCVCLSLI